MNIENKRLGDIATYINGYAFKPEQWDTEGKPIIRIQNLNNNLADFNYYSGDINEKYIVNKGDILISWSASIGVYEWQNEEALLNQHIFKVDFNKIDINKQYFKHMVGVALEKAMQFMHGSTMKHITKKYFDDIIIPIPSLSIQQEVANILHKSQELLYKRREQIEILDELVKSQFIEMFGDPFNDEKGLGIKRLGEVTEVNPKKAEIKELDKELMVSFVPMDRVGEKGQFNPEVSKPISEVYSGFTYFRDNDVLFAKITPCMENGKGAIAVNLSNGIGFGSTEFHVLRPMKQNSNPYWIYHLTTLIEFRRLAERKMTGSAGQKRVPTDFLSNIKVVVPPIELQNKFADFVKQTDKLKFEMEKSLKELEDNFNSLMQKAFNGELVN